MKKSSTPLNKIQHTPVSSEINKSLLTPCRRVGLAKSRSRRSITNIENVNKSPYLSTPNNQSLIIKESPVVSECTTPIVKSADVESIKRKIFSENIDSSNIVIKSDTPTRNIGNTYTTKESHLTTEPVAGKITNVIEETSNLKTKTVTQKRKLFCSNNDDIESKEPAIIQFITNDCKQHEVDFNSNISDCTEREIILKIRKLEHNVSTKKVKLEDLKRASLYQKKHNLEELKQVMNKWRNGCQQALIQLQEIITRRKGIETTMRKLIDDLNIPYELVNYNVEMDCFNNNI